MDSALCSLRSGLRRRGVLRPVSEWPPHITVAAYESAQLGALLRWTEAFAAKHAAFDVMFSSLGVFPPGGAHKNTAVLYAAPASSKGLIDFYYGFHEKFDEHCGGLGWLYSAQFGFPVPHATIGTVRVKQLGRAMRLVLKHPFFGPARVTALEVYTYPMELIQRFDLS